MDRFIASHAQVEDDLVVLHELGIAYQRSQKALVDYGEAYFDKCAGYEGQAIGEAIHAGRVAFVAKHYGAGPMLDVGIGSGAFIRARPDTWGTDVNPKAIAWLRDRGQLARADELHGWPAYSFWDVIEHIPTPEDYFRLIRPGSWLFTSLPLFEDLRRIRDSRHYRPDEHLYYWTREGFIRWMGWHGFALVERSDFETRAGRDSIESFAFRKR